jgi:hypothetical protein
LPKEPKFEIEESKEAKKIKPVEPHQEIELEKVYLEKIGYNEFKEFLQLFSYSIESFGDFISKMGRIEKKTGLNFSDVSKLMMNPDYMDELVKVFPPDIVGLFLKTIYRASVLNNIKIDQLNADEKIKMGEEMKTLAKDLNVLFEKVDSFIKKSD